MKTSESILEISAALIQAHAEMKEVKKNAENPFTKSEYADLKAVLEVIRPILSAHGLALVQFPSFRDGCVYLVSRLIHSSGQWFEEEASAGALAPDPQKAGSAITYLRRYSAMAICGIASEDDDASQSEFAKRKKPKGQAVAPAREVTEKSMEAIIKGLPFDIREGLKFAGIFGVVEAHQLYRIAKGDLVVMEKLITEKIKARKK
jgi:hypothetical protein